MMMGSNFTMEQLTFLPTFHISIGLVDYPRNLGATFFCITIIAEHILPMIAILFATESMPILKPMSMTKCLSPLT